MVQKLFQSLFVCCCVCRLHIFTIQTSYQPFLMGFTSVLFNGALLLIPPFFIVFSTTAMIRNSERKNRLWNIFCMRMKTDWHKICATGFWFAYKSPKSSAEPHFLSHHLHHSLPLTTFIPPPPPHLCSSASTSSLPLSSCYRHCPPTCLPVLVQPPLSASVNVFCPYKERAQADCTNRVSSVGVLQGQGDHSDCNGGVRWEEDGEERMEGLWGVSSHHASVNDSK